MRILQLTNKPPWPATDGGTIAMLNLTKGLARLRHRVTVLSMSTRKHPARVADIPDDLREMADFRFVRVPAGISLIKAVFNLLFSRQPYNAIRFISKSFKIELTRTLREFKPDIVQLEGLYLCPYIPVIRNNSDAKIAYRAHNIESEIWQRSAVHSSGLKKLYLLNLASRIEKFEKGWLNGYDFLVPITERDQNKLNMLGNQKPSHVSPSGIDFETTAADMAKIDFPSIFHIGSLDWFPNQEGVLWFIGNCWEKLCQRHSGLRFYIAGRKAPDWLVARFHQPNVVFMGEVENAFDFMKSKAIMVVPLLSGSGMRVKIVEGMALGKTVVTTSIGAEGIKVTDGHNILIADQPEDFVRAIEMLIGNRQESERIGMNAKQFIRENYDNMTITSNLADFYLNHLQ